jgi:hypothetical protein
MLDPAEKSAKNRGELDRLAPTATVFSMTLKYTRTK